MKTRMKLMMDMVMISAITMILMKMTIIMINK